MVHKSYIRNCYECRLNQKYNMKGLVGGPLLVGAWGPGPLPPPSNPALRSFTRS